MEIEQKLKQFMYDQFPDEQDQFWLNRYFKFIESRPERVYDSSIYQYHHIVPRSCSEKLIYYKPNIVILTKKEHIVIHHILSKVDIEKFVRGLWIVVKTNQNQFNENVIKRIINEATYKLAEYTGRPVANLETGEVYPSSNQAARELGLGLPSISYCINHITRVNNCYWCYVDQLKDLSEESRKQKLEEYQQIISERHEAVYDTKRRKVICLDTKQIFKSIVAASQSIGMNDVAVGGAIRGDYRVGGYFWQYVDVLPNLEDETIQKELKRLEDKVANNQPFTKSRKVQCIETGEIFESTVKASRSQGGCDSVVSIAISKNRPLRNGTHWRYVE